jgi:hypothetical protein
MVVVLLKELDENFRLLPFSLSDEHRLNSGFHTNLMDFVPFPQDIRNFIKIALIDVNSSNL